MARLERGELTAARVDMDAFGAVVARIDEPLVAWNPALWDAMRLQLAGRAGEAADATATVLTRGAQAHSINASQLGDTQRFWLSIDATTLAVLDEHRRGQRLGHSDVSITLSLYAHVPPSDDRDAANLVATAIDEQSTDAQ